MGMLPTSSMMPQRFEIVQHRVKNCGMNFDWGLFEFTKADCTRLSKAVGSSRTLQVLRVCCSKMADERGRVLASHILDHPSLKELGEPLIITFRVFSLSRCLQTSHTTNWAMGWAVPWASY